MPLNFNAWRIREAKLVLRVFIPNPVTIYLPCYFEQNMNKSYIVSDFCTQRFNYWSQQDKKKRSLDL